jgi:uncharacterized membrane-anchored protein YitT (DUF2179 family)
MFNKDHISTNLFNQNERKVSFVHPHKYTAHLLNITNPTCTFCLLHARFSPSLPCTSYVLLIINIINIPLHVFSTFSLEFLFTCVAEIYTLSVFAPCPCTTGHSSFAECHRYSAKAILHSAKALPSVTLDKERSTNCTSATASLPSAI